MSVEIVRADPGINGWLTAAYRAKSKRIVLLEEGDEIDPDFYPAYGKIIGPALDKGDAGFATWQTKGMFYGADTNTIFPSNKLREGLGEKDGFTLSPSIAVLNRSTVIRACKEAQDTLWLNDSLEVPGKRLGTEILIYLRHIELFKRWLYVDQALTKEGSRAYVSPKILEKGNVLAVRQGLGPAPYPSPRIILTYSSYEPKDQEAKERHAMAQDSWADHFETGKVIGCPYSAEGLPKIRGLLDYAASVALPEDILCYANADAGLTTQAAQKLIEGVSCGFGVTCCAKRAVPIGGRYADLTQYKRPGGIEMFAMTPAWWKRHRDLMPDMFIGREAWDAVLMTLAEEWADGVAMPGICNTDGYHRSKAHTDNVCWHVEHPSFWAENRMDEGNRHNRELARAFFAARNKKTIWEHE